MILNKSTKTVTTPTAKANNPAPVSSGKANVKTETPNSNIQAKPKVVGGNADYIAPPKNTKTINTPSAKVDTTPTNKSIDSNVNKDVKSVDVETKGTSKNLLSNDGKFKDSKLESDYENYLARKGKIDKTPRERFEWKKTRDYWLNDYPMARGNNFNKTAREDRWYPYDEVHLSNGKRLDSYDPIKGEIVARKATDLIEIDIKTFEKYLKELNNKYPAGTKIRSNKYERIDGTILQGKQILEIPATNKNFTQIEEYIKLAKDKYDVEIRFRRE